MLCACATDTPALLFARQAAVIRRENHALFPPFMSFILTMKNCILPLLLVLLAAFSIPVDLRAQIYVDADNEVGIGTTFPSAKLNVVNSSTGSNSSFYISNGYAGASTKYSASIVTSSDGSASHYGIYNTLYSASGMSNTTCGMYNYLPSTVHTANGIVNDVDQASSSTGVIRGVYNDISANGNVAAYGSYTVLSSLSGSSGNRYGDYVFVSSSGSGSKYGVFSSVAGSSNYAGYFSGNVIVTGTFTNPSDAITKKNVQPIPSALGTIARLQPRSYEYRQDMGLGLPEGQQFGFVAQDLAQLVKNVQAPVVQESATSSARAADGSLAEPPAEPDYTTIKSVNYIGLIPILTQAIQELEAKVDAQAQLISTLQAEIKSR
jgi:hypothetical protein